MTDSIDKALYMNSDEEIFDTYFLGFESSNKNKVSMPLTPKKQRSNDMDMLINATEHKSCVQRTRSKLIANKSQLTNKNSIVDSLYKLCKPVSIRLTKLSESEIMKACNPSLSKKCSSEIHNRHKHEWKKKENVLRARRKNTCYNQMSNPCGSNNNVRAQIVAVNKRQTFSRHKRHTTNILKSIRQPQIRLHKIDRVIDKITKSLANTTSNKVFIANDQTQQLSLCNNRDTNPKNETTESSILNPCLCKDTQTSHQIQDNSNKVHKINDKQTLKRKPEIVHDIHYNRCSDENVNKDVFNVTLRRTKRFKLNSLKENLDTFVSTEEHESISKSQESINKLQTESNQKENVPNKSNNFLSNQAKNISEDTFQENVHNVAVERMEGDCVSRYVPLEIDFVHTTENNVYSKLQENNTVNEEVPILESNEIQNQEYQLCTSYKDLIQKYKLFTDLKVCLIKFDFLETSFNNKYSVTEIEQLMKKYIKSLVFKNSNVVHTTERPLLFDSIEFEDFIIKSEKPDDFSVTESIAPVPVSANNCQNESGSITEDSNLNNKMEAQQDRCPKNQSVSKNHTTSCKDVLSEEEYSTNASSSPANISTKGPETSTLIEDAVYTTTSEGVSNKYSFTKSANKILSSWTEKLQNTWSRNDKFEKLLSTVRLLENTDVNKPKFGIGKISAFRDDSFISGNKISRSKLHSKSMSSANYEMNLNEKTNSTKIFPRKCREFIDKADNDKNNIFSGMYKCIFCDKNFKKYPVLQQHLSEHTPKQKTISAGKPKETELLHSSKITPQVVSAISKNKHKKRLQWRKLKSLKETNECEDTVCTICLQKFASRAALAAHIYTHTESELQEAYKVQKEKLEKLQEKQEDKNGRESAIAKEKKTRNNANGSIKRCSKIENKKDKNCSELSVKYVQDSSVTAHSENKILEPEKLTDKDETSEPIILIENESRTVQTFPLQNKSEKEKINKVANVKKKFTVCQCHNKSEVSLSYLQIEVILLCHVCRVLFRTLECFETHYRLPEYVACNKNCVDSGRSPNLFCASCGMSCSSAEDVRNHLETHFRFKQNCTMDFRCNICKVMFIGVGSLFYTHWSKHAKDPFWIASEHSFPKASVIHLKSKKDTFIQVAENICCKCRLPFITESDLKEHELVCKILNSITNTCTVQKQPTLRLICSLCGGIYFDKVELYKHMRTKHKFGFTPQFICLTVAMSKKIYICSICMEANNNMNNFEEHWVVHNTNHPYFLCTYCETNFNTLDSYLEHAKGHESKMKEDMLSCRINYRKCEFICEPCIIGFGSKKSLTDHQQAHKVSRQSMKPMNNETLGQRSSASTPETNNVSNEKEEEKSKKNEVNVVAEKSSRDIDKERLVNILEGNEEDSENELIIDLTDNSTEVCDKLTRKDKTKEKQIASTPALNVLSDPRTCMISKDTEVGALVKNTVKQKPLQNVVTTSAVSDQVTQSLTNVTGVLPSKDTVTSTSSQNIASNQKTSESNAQVNDTNNLQSVTPVNKDSSLTTDAPLKPKQGLLRVKTIAELTEKTNPIYSCYSCNCSFKCSDDIMQHLIMHATQSQQIEQKKARKSNPIPLQIVNEPGGTSNLVKIASTHQNRPVYQIPVTSALESTKSHNATIIENQQLQLQSNTNRKEYSHSSVQTLPPAYHKNLPPCNIVQRMVVPRSSIQKKGVTIRAVTQIPPSATCSDIQYQNSQKHQETSRSKPNLNSTTLALPQLQAVSMITSNNSKYQNKCQVRPEYNANNVTRVFLHKSQFPRKEQQMKNEAVVSKRYVGNPVTTNKVNFTSNGQTLKQGLLQPTLNQSRANTVTTTVLHESPSFATNDPNNYNQMPVQSQQMVRDRSVVENTTTSQQYKNSTSGGVLIVQTAPSISNISTINVLQQQVQQHQQQQQQTYQPVVYNNSIVTMDPYMQQSQSVINYTGSNNYEVVSNRFRLFERDFIAQTRTRVDVVGVVGR
ncbi:uncharacterized protein LOC122395592 isoform X2 [Colletes gigas]|uniref:uncharacterized protein LOC122395592 isoform X2 n=1 Tax=Colletes gigas TaxID=935657 RepID=UPI001C9ACA67|nr:uncharacterized protein LOC122395592 isoform X2 [Colletes gigas]